MAAEPIAKVIADLRARNVRNVVASHEAIDRKQAHQFAHLLLDYAADAVVVDATALYEDMVERPRPVAMYEDHPCITPPFKELAVCYQNHHGNVHVMCGRTVEPTIDPATPPWETDNDCDWSQVRWIHETFLWLGGRGASGPFATAGPLFGWAFAIYADGRPGDIHWYHIEREYPADNWDMAQCVLLATLNFLNARNVELVEPSRPRAERRRLERTGVTVKTLTVFAAGKSSRSAGGPGVGTPLTSVRGHYACYGPQYGRKLLFGKLDGRFWIPAHARGSTDQGEHRNDYKVKV